ncbi:MAG: hypothetical protein KGI67_09110 [Pseudomonadota bacterium]|nr:hypothetical protein [Pseudomonadota bacterium]
MVLVDSSVWIALLRGSSSAQVIALRALLASESAALAPVIYQEILQGAASAQAAAVKLISMPGPDGSLKLVDVGVMPASFDKGMMVILCDAQCQGVLHLVGKPTADSKQVAMGVTLYVDAHSAAAKLLGGH